MSFGTIEKNEDRRRKKEKLSFSRHIQSQTLSSYATRSLSLPFFFTLPSSVGDQLLYI